MKNIVYVIIVFVFGTVLLFANPQIIESFKATNSNDVVTIEWKTISEKNVSMFELQRLTNGTFKTIHYQTTKGVSSTYKYTDADSFTKEINSDNIQSSNATTYRIKIIYSNNSPATYTDEISVTRNLNSIKRTLGMLKEMFK
ncbi:MAG: hypothetical protein FWG85_02575 [Bacteroidetes bacterium]|nr:hypothetical protein [Bacteroidota bacterium]